MDAAPSRAQRLAEAYRRGILPPDKAQRYEEAARRGIVDDHYAAARSNEKHDGWGVAGGAVNTFTGAIPFLNEGGAALGAGEAALGNMFHGKPANFGGEFNNQRAAQQGSIDQFKADHPIAASTAQGLGYGAQMATALATGGASEVPAATTALRTGLVAGAKRLGARTARNAITGATIGAMNGAAQPGTLQQRVASAAGAVPSGAVIGAALPAGAKAITSVVKPAYRLAVGGYAALDRALSNLSPAEQAAALPPKVLAQGKEAALTYLQKMGVTPEALMAAKGKAAGLPITTAEAIGPRGISQATALSRLPGTTPDVAYDTMTARAAERSNRILGHIQDATGIDAPTAKGDIASIVKNGRATAAPLYDAAYSQVPPQNDALDALMNRPSMRGALNRAARIAAEEGRNPNTLGFQFDSDGNVKHVNVPSVQTLDYVKRGLDDTLNARRDPVTGKLNLDEEGRAILGTLNQFRDIATTPNTEAGRAYGAALDASGDYLSINDAYNRAKGTLFGAARDPRDFDAYFQGLKPAQQDAVRGGMANDVYTKLNNGQLRPSAMANNAVAQKLTTAFGADKAQALLDKMQTEAAMSAASARMTPNLNSVTGDVIGSQATGGLGDVAEAGAKAAFHAATGNKVGLIRSVGSGLAAVGRLASQDSSVAARNAFGDYLYSDPQNTADSLSARINAINARPIAQVPRSISALQYLTSAQSGAGAYDQPNQ